MIARPALDCSTRPAQTSRGQSRWIRRRDKGGGASNASCLSILLITRNLINKDKRGGDERLTQHGEPHHYPDTRYMRPLKLTSYPARPLAQSTKATRDAAIKQFRSITNATAADATRLMKQANYQVQSAVELFFKDGAAQKGAAGGSSSSAGASASSRKDSEK